MKILAIIPARGGSKGIVDKNIRMVGGKPLIVWTIDEAKKCEQISRLIVSTDDSYIGAVAIARGCEVLVRPPELATDEASSIDVVLHAINNYKDEGFTHVMLLQPTSPCRLACDIDAAVAGCFGDCIVSISETQKSPYLMLDENFKPIVGFFFKSTNRQDYRKTYVINGAVYLADIEWFLSTQKFLTAETDFFVMPQERSVDVDTEDDLYACERILRSRQ